LRSVLSIIAYERHSFLPRLAATTPASGISRMSITTQVLPLSAPSAAKLFDVAPGASRLTSSGLAGFVLGLSLVVSGFNAGRADFGGLKVHPYLYLIAVLFLPLAATRLRLLPVRTVLALVGFGAFYFASTFVGGVAVQEIFKVTAAVVTILTMAMLVRSRQDFVATALGMTLAIGSLAIRGMRTDMSGGLEAIENANRNAYSLYALPCLLMSGFAMLRFKCDLWLRCLLLIGVLALILGISLNLNRSGWLGMAVIATLLLYERSLKAAVSFALVGIVVAAALSFFFDLSHVQDRIIATRQGLQSDDVRWRLFATSIEIGMENPLLGISPQELAYELSARIGTPGASIETHNVFAHIIGGSGVICLFLMFYCGYQFWNRRLPSRLPPVRLGKFREARRLMRYMLILWLVRGFFSHEIIYSPAFCMALGICTGLCLLPAVRLPARGRRRVPVRAEYRADDLIGVG
jgi:hypothetical protein